MKRSSLRLVAPQAGQVIETTPLPGRPRWAVYDQRKECFLVNIREPAVVAVLSASSFSLVEQFPITAPSMRKARQGKQLLLLIWFRPNRC